MTETSTKLDSLTAEPVEKLSPNPSKGFEFLNSAEMAAASIPAPSKPEGKPACGWSTPKIYSLNEVMMRL